jgi:hypothetical protein
MENFQINISMADVKVLMEEDPDISARIQHIALVRMYGQVLVENAKSQEDRDEALDLLRNYGEPDLREEDDNG